MPRANRDEPIVRALLEVAQSVRNLASRTRGICELGDHDGRPMDPLVQRARDLLTHLDAAGQSMNLYEERDEASYKIERKPDEKGDERIVIRCVSNMLEDLSDEAEGNAAAGARPDLRGSTWSLRVPELLSFFESLNKSGTLSVATFDETFSVVLEEGKVVHAWSDASPIGERLGDFLVRHGFTSVPELREFIAAHDGNGCLGEALIKHEFVTREQLSEALQSQIQALFSRMFAAEDATFTFFDGETDSPSIGVRMNVTRLLLESAFEADRATK